MGKRSIYRSQSQEIAAVFEEAGNGKKIMCVPTDYAKETHVAMFCNGNGEFLRKPFPVKNTPEGIEYLLERVESTCRKRNIKRKHVIFGGEDGGPYIRNFVDELRAKGCLVVGLNAKDVKDQRENMQASTDKLALHGIAKMILNRRGSCDPPQEGVYRNLRNITRMRRGAVRMGTAVKNRIGGLVDQIFPGFLDEKRSGVAPFSEGSVWLMGERFSPKQIKARKRATLIEGLQREGTPGAERRAKQLQEYASSVLCAPPQYLPTLQSSLSQQIELYRCLRDSVEQYERELAVWLAQTQGALLTTVKGIGLTLAAGVVGELGDPVKQREQHVMKQIVSYSGIIPRTIQTGGPEKEAHSGPVTKRCNRILKDHTVQSGSHVGRQGPDELVADYKRREANGQHADFGIARRFLRAAISMMVKGQIYLPEHLRNGNCTREYLVAYYFF